MEKVIDIRNLRISFKTNNGTVKAVRDISFSLNKGETLAIVGESGSGKSVTARSIMGIQAGNSITEGGEIFFSGQDLTKISEEDFHKIRGNKISMIFQDPFSSLNPIVRIGTQLTEAMLINGKINRRNARRDFNKRLKLLASNLPNLAAVKKVFEKYGAAELAQNEADDGIALQITAIDGVLANLVRSNPKSMVQRIEAIISDAESCIQKQLQQHESVSEAIVKLKSACEAYRSSNNSSDISMALVGAKSALSKVLEHKNKVGFTEMFQTELKQDFELDFLGYILEAVKASDEATMINKTNVLNAIDKYLPLFANDTAKPSEYKHAIKEMEKAMAASMDPLATSKDSLLYSFSHGCDAALNVYFKARKQKHSNKNGDELETGRKKILELLHRARDIYLDEVNNAEHKDYMSPALKNIEKLKDDAYKMSGRITKKMAKMRAIGLMEEVGIAEARDRYRQYPFQFSGGMRQRIVIAIALAANPDLLICDEPTTALDVTIQAQILDLINNLKEKRGLSVIFITHDLGVVANVADHVAVMYAGKVVEYGTANEIFFEPAHPYTWALLASMPDLETTEKLDAIPGTPPNMIHPPKGDAFAARNKYAMEIDFEEEPPLFDISPTHKAATWLLHPNAPKVEPPAIVTERIKRMQITEGV